MQRSFTPLRYPGGKAKIYPLVSSLIHLNTPERCTYIEPFAGGAGLALKLLFENDVNGIVINDYDYAIYSIWNNVINHSDHCCDFILNVPLTISEWNRQREIYKNQEHHTGFEVGNAALYLNRTNVSGVLKGGVIGGLAQEGSYKIDARFNRTSLVEIIKRIASRKNDIEIFNWNAVDFINKIIPNYSNTFVYYDPPYVKKGHCLYKNAFKESDHRQLCETIISSTNKWIVTYDDCDFIRNLYKDYSFEIINVNYSVGKTKNGAELIVYGPSISLASGLQANQASDIFDGEILI